MSATVESLCRGFAGYFVRPADDRYDQLRRVWNDMIDRRPAVIARCVNGDDVVACVRAAGRLGLPVTVRGGGHNVVARARRRLRVAGAQVG